MKTFAILSALVVALTAGNIFAGEVSQSSLAKMGLGSMTKMSDSQGHQVRGMGTYAYAQGISASNAGHGNFGIQSYAAGASHNYGSSSANGSSYSVSGSVNFSSHGFGGVVAGSIGGASAHAR